jgi:clathrin heavy chain
MLRREGQTDKIVLYALPQHIMRTNPEKGAAAQLASEENGPLVDIERVVGIVQPATSFLLDALNGNKPARPSTSSTPRAQPRHAPAILGNEMFTLYDRPRIAIAGLLQRVRQACNFSTLIN